MPSTRKHLPRTRRRAAFCSPGILGALTMTLSQTIPSIGQSTNRAAAPTTEPGTQFLLGADISTLSQVEQRGGIFRDRGQPADALKIFTRHGWNAFRLRLFVNPDGRGGVINDLPYTLALAKRIKASGAALLLDFHYSDTWADPQHQIKPAAWKDLTVDQLEARVEQYTDDVIKQFRDAGALPRIVQIGNEITGGTLWPEGQVQVPLSTVKVYEGDVQIIHPPRPYDDAKQWDQLARFLKAGVRGVQSASSDLPAEQRPRVMFHIDCAGDWPVTKWFFDHLADHAVPFDLIGQSYYPHWHGTIQNVRDNLRHTATRYGKPIVIVETAYPWTDGPRWVKQKNMAWPVSAAGQQAFMRDLIAAVRDTPDDLGAGVFYWHPESLPLRGADGRVWNGGAMALFDQDANALPALDSVAPESATQP